jgi:hypothetical protein
MVRHYSGVSVPTIAGRAPVERCRVEAETKTIGSRDRAKIYNPDPNPNLNPAKQSQCSHSNHSHSDNNTVTSPDKHAAHTADAAGNTVGNPNS